MPVGEFQNATKPLTAIIPPSRNRKWALGHFQGQPRPSAAMSLCTQVTKFPMSAAASELFQDCLPFLLGCVVLLWLCVVFVCFLKINILSVACWQPSIFRSNTTVWCAAWGIKRNRRWHWVLLKLVIYCSAPLQVWWQRTDLRQVCLPWLKGITAGF